MSVFLVLTHSVRAVKPLATFSAGQVPLLLVERLHVALQLVRRTEHLLAERAAGRLEAFVHDAHVREPFLHGVERFAAIAALPVLGNRVVAAGAVTEDVAVQRSLVGELLPTGLTHEVELFGVSRLYMHFEDSKSAELFIAGLALGPFAGFVLREVVFLHFEVIFRYVRTNGTFLVWSFLLMLVELLDGLNNFAAAFNLRKSERLEAVALLHVRRQLRNVAHCE